MPIRNLDPDKLGHSEDWEGNNAAFACPACGKVFIVSDMLHHGPGGGDRECPNCGKSVARVKGGRKSGGTASIEWQD
jgi:predicted RNA-binding Zn-ribbon protein involved in translation (DUF1610 family)